MRSRYCNETRRWGPDCHRRVSCDGRPPPPSSLTANPTRLVVLRTGVFTRRDLPLPPVSAGLRGYVHLDVELRGTRLLQETQPEGEIHLGGAGAADVADVDDVAGGPAECGEQLRHGCLRPVIVPTDEDVVLSRNESWVDHDRGIDRV